MANKNKHNKAKQKRHKQRKIQVTETTNEPVALSDEGSVTVAASSVGVKQDLHEEVVSEKILKEHRHVFADLRFIGVSAVVLLVLLIVLSFVL